MWQGRYESAWQIFVATHDFDRWVRSVARIYAGDPEYAVKVLNAAHSDEAAGALKQAREHLISGS